MVELRRVKFIVLLFESREKYCIVGGFGHVDAKTVLEDPLCVQGFCFSWHLSFWHYYFWFLRWV